MNEMMEITNHKMEAKEKKIVFENFHIVYSFYSGPQKISYGIKTICTYIIEKNRLFIENYVILKYFSNNDVIAYSGNYDECYLYIEEIFINNQNKLKQ